MRPTIEGMARPRESPRGEKLVLGYRDGDQLVERVRGLIIETAAAVVTQRRERHMIFRPAVTIRIIVRRGDDPMAPGQTVSIRIPEG